MRWLIVIIALMLAGCTDGNMTEGDAPSDPDAVKETGTGNATDEQANPENDADASPDVAMNGSGKPGTGDSTGTPNDDASTGDDAGSADEGDSGDDAGSADGGGDLVDSGAIDADDSSDGTSGDGDTGAGNSGDGSNGDGLLDPILDGDLGGTLI